MADGSLDYWRKLFRSTNSDIIEVIESAILVAISDCPAELRSRRDRITEKLYACRCYDCGRGEELPSSGGDVVEEERGGNRKRAAEKESEVGSSNSSGGEELNPLVEDYSYNVAEALTEEIEEENEALGEVLRIKELIANHQDESDNVLFESLRRLQLMVLSVEALKATDIGRAVNGLRRHSSKQIRHLVRALVEWLHLPLRPECSDPWIQPFGLTNKGDWKNLVDQWVSASAAIAKNSPDSVSPVDMDEEGGLPSPPFDEGALWATQTTSIKLSEFFEGMDDDGNFRVSDEFDEDNENGKRHTRSLQVERKQRSPEDEQQMRRHEPIRQVKPVEIPNGHTKHNNIGKGEMRRQEQTKLPNIEEDMRWQGLVVRQTKPRDAPNEQMMSHVIGNKQNQHITADQSTVRPPKLSPEKKGSGETNAWIQKKPQSSPQDQESRLAANNSGPGRPQKPSSERRASCEMNAGVQKQPLTSIQDKLKNSEESSLRAKLEAAKRKLQENYQQAENAKKQRTVQVVELHDIPKKAHINRQPVPKHKSNIRNFLRR